MRWLIFALIVFLAGWGIAANQVVIQGTKVKIQADVRLKSLEYEVRGSSNTGQCMGLMCAITYPN